MSSGFLGRGWKFPVQVDPVTGRFMMSSGEEDIAESLGIILRTMQGERVMRPDFGGNLNNYVFSLTDATTLNMMETDLLDAIIRWEPRVEGVEVHVETDPSMPEKLMIHVKYTVRATNNLYNQVYPYYLSEGAS